MPASASLCLGNPGIYASLSSDVHGMAWPQDGTLVHRSSLEAAFQRQSRQDRVRLCFRTELRYAVCGGEQGNEV